MRRAALYLAIGMTLLATPAAAGSNGPAKPRTHQVHPGQTLGMIAKRYNVPLEALCNANGLQRRTPIKPNQKLLIPSASDVDGSEARDYRDGSSGNTRQTLVQTPSTRSKASVRSHALGNDRRASVEPYEKAPARRGYVTISSYTTSFSGYAVGRDGKVTEVARRGFERVLASWRTGKQEKIHGRLVRMLTKVSDHFGGRPLRVVSGFRPYSPQQYTPHSRHNVGRAVDFSIIGVPNATVRDFCMKLGNVGVGFYPNSSFVHLDVRETPTYWVDYSGPGQAPRYARASKQADTTVPASLSTTQDSSALEPAFDSASSAPVLRPARIPHLGQQIPPIRSQQAAENL